LKPEFQRTGFRTDQILSAFKFAIQYGIQQLTKNSDGVAVEFVKLIDSMNPHSLDLLANEVARNRMDFLFQDLLCSHHSNHSANMDRLRNSINLRVKELLKLRVMRDDVLKRLIGALVDSSIDYVIFKTLNKYGGVGVDIDILIPRQSYLECIRVLRSHGFYPIDDLSKTYETGFVMPGNSVIVDLHTDLAILGVSYLSPQRLLSNRISASYSLSADENAQELVLLNVLNDDTASLVTIAHSIIKECRIRGSDFLEVLVALTLHRDTLVRCVQEESLQFAAYVFAKSLSNMIPEISGPLSPFLETGQNKASSDFAHRLVDGLLAQSSNHPELPISVPPSVSLVAFIDRLIKRHELSRSVPRAISSFRYERNVARAGQKLFEYVMTSSNQEWTPS
jgi:hypothetical protein